MSATTQHQPASPAVTREVIDLYRETANHELVLRLTDEEYQRLMELVEQGDFGDLPTYLHYLLAVGESFVRLRLRGYTNLIAIAPESGDWEHVSASVGRLFKGSPRFNWTVLDHAPEEHGDSGMSKPAGSSRPKTGQAKRQ